MRDVTDEVAARREAARRRNGEFGISVHSTPELGLTPPAIPQRLADLSARADRARETYADALVEQIDASMPEATLFANYAAVDDAHHLYVRAAYDEDGEELGLDEFAHIDTALKELGTPYEDFDGDLVLDQEDEYGWDRTIPYNRRRAHAAEVAAYTARADWQDAQDAQQAVAVAGIRDAMGTHVDAIDFALDTSDGRLYIAGVLRADGRAESASAGEQDVTAIENLAAFLPDPGRAGLVCSELTGHWRLRR